ncbi:hypothetical protein EXIGLDRAFT_718530 [Exidia glandulosa HHB12029]|uniref:F-box domain-containing protein n=1 Tax=Exidia glandulosa HHB12029 TaxID=1314781 RepID=A0A165NZD9_EXIGL|nr:hypothetical protein EXIGLDRAFT_718530 [Exidia glandulosa HHB12029]
MSAHESGANLPASAADTVVVLERLAVQQEKIDAATRVLPNATPKLQHADRDLAETARPQASKSGYSHVQVAHSKATAGVTKAQNLLDETVNEIAVPRDAPLPPLRRTPPEVLGVIFEFCVYQDLDPRPDFGPRSNSPERSQPFILAGVCKFWRIAALMHPRVWAYIDLDFHSIDHDAPARWHQYLSNLLARSGASPLHIRCQWLQCRNTDRPFVHALLPHLHRCATLVLSISGTESGFHSAAPIINAYLPALRTLRLYATDFLYSSLTDVKGRLPLLTHVWLLCCSSRDVSFLLEAAPVITSLHLDRLDVSPHIQARSPPLVYSSLKSLTIRDCETDPVACLTDNIHFTALDALAAPGGSLGGYSRTVSIQLVTRTTISLTQLSLSCGDISKNTASVLRTALLRCRSLQRIKILTRFDRDGTSLQRFCDLFGRPADDGSWLCPSLTVIDISTCTFLIDSACGVQSLCELVRNRTSAAVDDTTAPTTYSAPVMLASVHLPSHDPFSDLVRSHVRAQSSHSLLRIFHYVKNR